jgi:hypothetical protein
MSTTTAVTRVYAHNNGSRDTPYMSQDAGKRIA